MEDFNIKLNSDLSVVLKGPVRRTTFESTINGREVKAVVMNTVDQSQDHDLVTITLRVMK